MTLEEMLSEIEKASERIGVAPIDMWQDIVNDAWEVWLGFDGEQKVATPYRYVVQRFVEDKCWATKFESAANEKWGTRA